MRKSTRFALYLGRNLRASKSVGHEGFSVQQHRKESSSQGFGRCAHLDIEGTVARDTDANMWVVFRDIKHNRLVWKKNTGNRGEGGGRNGGVGDRSRNDSKQHRSIYRSS